MVHEGEGGRDRLMIVIEKGVTCADLTFRITCRVFAFARGFIIYIAYIHEDATIWKTGRRGRRGPVFIELWCVKGLVLKVGWKGLDVEFEILKDTIGHTMVGLHHIFDGLYVSFAADGVDIVLKNRVFIVEFIVIHI